ncbi:MAG: class I SAM-dependent methyltransferase [Nitrospirota bacterium]|nr:class I SAM-dependent methyltransferase [Nitrospirota bacterium]
MENVVCEFCRTDQAEVVIRQRDLLHGISTDEFHIVRCIRCGFLYLNPRPTQADIGKFYPVQYFAPASPPRRFSKVKTWIVTDFYGYPGGTTHGLWRRLRKLLLWPEKVRRDLCGRGSLPWVGRGRLLDVGCGHGVNAALLKQQGWQVQGLDLSTTAVEHARGLLGTRVDAGDLLSVKYEDHAFDVVLMSHSLEHMYALPAVLAEARRILDDDGVLVIAVPNADSLEAKLFGRWWVNWDPPRHLYHFTRTTLGRLLGRAGFHVVRSRTGVTSAHFMTSLERVWTRKCGRALHAKKWIERFLIRPLCLVMGNLGYGTEITVYAVKARAGSERSETDRRAAV